MRALVTRGRKDFEVIEIPVPELSEDQDLVETKWATMCGSDFKKFLGETQDMAYSLGHKWSGKVTHAEGSYSNLV